MGEWERKQCEKGYHFDKLAQACAKAKNIRRHCAGGGCHGASYQCSTLGINAVPFYGGMCSWLTSPLVADPLHPAQFLQCVPASNKFASFFYFDLVLLNVIQLNKFEVVGDETECFSI